jgi:hypothetical protein
MAAAPALAASAPKTSHTLYWKNGADTFNCGIKAHPKGTPAKLMLCSADAVPQPKGVPPDGDPADQLGAHGKPKLIESHDTTYAGKHELALATGTTWTGVGVSCTVGVKNVTCKNKDGHGFTMGHAVYKTF